MRETAYEFLSKPAARALSGAGLERAVRDRRTGLRVSALPELPHSEGYTAAGLANAKEDGVFGSTDFAGVQHEFDFSAGGSLADESCGMPPRDVPRIVEGCSIDGSAAQDVPRACWPPVLSADEPARPRPLSWLMRCRQAAFRLGGSREGDCSVRQRRSEGTKGLYRRGVAA